MGAASLYKQLRDVIGPAHNRALVVQMVTSALLVCELVAAKATRDALFLSRFGATALPQAMALSALLALATAFAASALMRRFGPVRSTRLLLNLSAALLAVEAACVERLPGLVVGALYLQVAALGASIMSGFWALVTEHFDARTARMAVARIAAAAPLGGLLGGLGAAPLLSHAGAPALLSGLCVLQLLAMILLGRLPPNDVAATAAAPSRAALRELGASAYLRRLSLLVASVAVIGTVLDYTFKARAAESFGDASQLLGFFGAVYTGVSVASALVQLGIVHHMLIHIGLGGTLAFLPGFAVVGSIAALFVPELVVVMVLRGGVNVLENTTFRSAYEPLYTPLPAEQKRSVKTIIDVASQRFGDTIGATFVLAVVAISAQRAGAAALVAAVVAAILALWLSLSAHRGYVAELARSLRYGVVKLTLADVRDRTTQLTLSQTAVEMDRETLLRQIGDLESRTPPAGTVLDGTQKPDPVEALAALVSGEASRIRPVLEAGLDPRLLSFALPLLEHDAIADLVAKSLLTAAREHVGALADALLGKQPAKVRRRLVRLLQDIDDDRAQAALCAALDDPERDVRYRAALALRSMHQRFGRLPPRALLLAAIGNELLATGGASPLVAEGSAGKDTHSLKYVFALLSLLLDREPVELSLTALLRGDAKLRGAALEYLENVLPQPLRDRLLPRLGPAISTRRTLPRGREEIVDELKRSLDGRELADVAASLSQPPD